MTLAEEDEGGGERRLIDLLASPQVKIQTLSIINSLSGDLPGVRVGVRDALLDGLLQDPHVLLQARGGPRVQQLVQELAAVPTDLLGLDGRDRIYFRLTYLLNN